MLFSSIWKRATEPRFLALWAVLGMVLWAYWSTLTELASRWDNDPQYSQGYMIPLLAAGVLFFRRATFPDGSDFSWWGVALVVAGVGLRAVGTAFYFDFIDIFSLLPIIAGCLLCVGGWPLLRWAVPGLVLLLFIVPLPFRIEEGLSGPLRKIAAAGSAFVLQILGFPSIVEENIILVNEVKIGVVEACSGLGMMMTLFAMITAVAIVTRWPMWKKGFVIASTIPIAVLANIVRITATGILYELSGSEVADTFYHDLAGWVMMPTAMLFLWVELLILDRLFVDLEDWQSSSRPFAARKGPAAIALVSKE